MPSVDVVVLGCGWAGILASYFILRKNPNLKVVCIEASSTPGGLFKSQYVNGFIFDIGGSHVIFSSDSCVLQEMLMLLEGNVISHNRHAYIYTDGTLVPYPFENGIYVLPPEIRAELATHFILAQIELMKKRNWRPRNLRDWIVNVFGKAIAERYLIPYNKKIWKRPLEQISADWVYIPGRLPQPDIHNIMRSVAGIPTIGYVENAYFYYPAKGGIQALYDAILQELKNRDKSLSIKKGERVKVLKKLNDGYLINNRFKVDKVISTIPLPELVETMSAPEDVIKAARRLDYNQVIVVGVALDRPAPKQHWIYVPQHDIIFHRYAWISNYSEYNAPQGKSAVIAEITVPKNSPINVEWVKNKVLEDLSKIGIIRKEEILFVRAWVHTYGYPIYTISHKSDREIITNWLSEQDIIMLGRWGSWHYWNMDKVYENVLKTINNIAFRL